MSDVSFLINPKTGIADIKIVDGDIYLGDELQTAVQLSLFTDARALINPEPRTESVVSALRGWWADSQNIEPLGSLFWTFKREKQTQNVLNGVNEAFTNALQWLIDDGVASEINVETTWSTTIAMAISVQIIKPNTADTNFSWEFAWSQFN